MPVHPPPPIHHDASSRADAAASTSQGGLWSLRLLGAVEAHGPGRSLTRWPSRAVAALLARLAMAPDRAHPREELVELLWPGVALDVGRNRLRQVLSTLKSILEPVGASTPQPVLAADRLSIRLVKGRLVCDVTAFEQLARSGAAEAALAMYGGELLPGFYDEWIDDERRRLAALHERMALHVSTPRADTLPRPAPAHLAKTDAAGASLAATPPRGPAPGTQVLLPTYLTRLFGAAQAMAQLAEAVSAHRLVTIVGPGGAGKTRLAVETARQLGSRIGPAEHDTEGNGPFDLVAFVSLLTCSTRGQACDALISTLQIASGADGALLALSRALAGRRVLLVLDNLEQLVPQADNLVSQLVTTLPRLHVLATSRRALGLDGEREFALGPLTQLTPLSLQRTQAPAGAPSEGTAAATNPAVALFVDRAQAVRSDFHLSTRNAGTLSELVHALEGMPLAIELAAARMRSITPAEMLARLGDAGTPRLDLLARKGPRGAFDPRHSSMQRTIEWSWQLLTPEQTRLLTALTVFGTSFSADAARVLTRGDGLSSALVLDELVAASLVHAQRDGEGLRFALYQPIREYAASQLDAVAGRHWRARLRAWAIEWARALPATPSLAALRAEMSNLVHALASAVADDASAEAIALLLTLRRCLEDVELPAEGLAHAQAAVAACPDALLRAQGLSLLAAPLFVAGQAANALQHAQDGLAAARTCGAAPAILGRALHTVARVRWRSRRRAEEVEPLLDEAQALPGATADLELQASLLALRAFVTNAHHRDHVLGEQLHAQALALWQRLGNQHAIDSGRYNLAVCAQNANRHADTLARLQPVIASARQLQDWRRLSQSLNVRGNAHSGLRQWSLAVADYQDCLRVAWSGMASYDLAFGLWNLPRALAHLRRPEVAMSLMAFAAAFWTTHFGELSPTDQRYVLRVRRLVQGQASAADLTERWQQGERMTLPQAVAMALAVPTGVPADLAS